MSTFHTDDPLVRRMAFMRELGMLLDDGYTGNITIHCLKGEIRNYVLEQHVIPGQSEQGAARTG